MKQQLTPEEEYYLSEARLNKSLTIRNYIKMGAAVIIMFLMLILMLMIAKMFFFGI